MMENKEFDNESLIPKGKVYKNRMVWVGSFLGGPLVAGYIIAENFKVLGKSDKMKITWILTILSTLVIFLIAFQIPEEARGIRSIPFIYTAIAALLSHYYQGQQVSSHIQSGGMIHSWWRVIAVGLIGLTIAFVTIFSVCVLFDVVSATGASI